MRDCSCKVPVTFVRLQENLNFIDLFFHANLSMGVKSFHADVDS